MPASSLQSRITAFESLSAPRSTTLQSPLQPRVIPSTPPKVSPSPSPPSNKSSLIDVKIDLKDWVFDDGSPPRSNGFKKTPTQASFNSDDALIHFSPPKPSVVKPPPLPPRKPSLTSLKSNSSSASLPAKKSTITLPLPVRRGDSLTVEHTYPPLESRGHTHGSSISSFHSVSLSDRSPSPSPTAAQHTIEHTTGSSAESFEEVSASSAFASPTTAALISHDWEKAMARRQQQPPKLPARPPTTTVSPPPPTRRPAPPPPPSDRASIRSFTSVSSSASASTSKSALATPIAALTARPPPVPPAPRRRYDALFSSLYTAHGQRPALLTPRRRTAAGWRGLSIDLIRDPDGAGVNSQSTAVDDDAETLSGPVIRVLWSRSRLPLPLLSSIWNECDPGRTGALDRESFARGMWRIDEELRKAEANRTSGGRRRGLR
ncbi:hypothetical protein R3P38DRAFT_3262492 [Favolaschia claudopus]|uniref:EH domain-containing protein n=1 Tax=Favolaschia claudopus TaxID=2862362 RepID=A0AAW0CE46_9AGAR